MKIDVKTAAILLAVLCQTCLALYDGKDVILLNPSTFDAKLKNSDEIWIVEFYAPWCGFCKQFAPEYAKAAKALKGIAKVAAVDCDIHKSLAAQYKIQGFPTVMIFGEDKNNPRDYAGDRNAASLVDHTLRELRKIADGRLLKRGSGGSSGKQSGSSKQDVVELTDSNFNSKVLNSPDMWLVEFYAPWCGHCKNLAPHWESAATELKGKVHLGAVDATVYKDLASQYGVRGYPTIKFFPAGSKSDAEDYTGGRTTADIVSWAMGKVEASLPPPKVTQLMGQQNLEEACSDKQLCIISILPQLLDCQSDCRNNYINTLQSVADNYKRNLWGWLWAEAMAQPELEDSLEIGGFGYPAMAVVNARKMKYSILRGSFSQSGIKEFMREVAVGRGASAPIKGAKLPTIVATGPWDGKDAELPVEEDIDLSDVTLEEPVKSEL